MSIVLHAKSVAFLATYTTLAPSVVTCLLHQNIGSSTSRAAFCCPCRNSLQTPSAKVLGKRAVRDDVDDGPGFHPVQKRKLRTCITCRRSDCEGRWMGKAYFFNTPGPAYIRNGPKGFRMEVNIARRRPGEARDVCSETVMGAEQDAASHRCKFRSQVTHWNQDGQMSLNYCVFLPRSLFNLFNFLRTTPIVQYIWDLESAAAKCGDQVRRQFPPHSRRIASPTIHLNKSVIVEWISASKD